MLLSVIIVNYNVKYFLEQCLCSVQAALADMAAEIIVVDNCSSDGSTAYLQPRFPRVTFIQNKMNEGFAKANNKALHLAKGEYILYLNPDTILAEDSLQQCVDFLIHHTDAGAAGVRMIDGAGVFLPESKRAFPSPLISFYKLTGLASLFPKSAIFNRYALGFLPQNEVHEVDVLAGAFMMVRKSVLDKIGGFDEQFFMYAEDIDLSYRIQKAGYKNYYLGNITILHFKGESTKKGSLNYVRIFYQAMWLFVKKHYGAGRGVWFVNKVLYTGIFLRQILSALALPVYSKRAKSNPLCFKNIYITGDHSQTVIAINMVQKNHPKTAIQVVSDVRKMETHTKENALVFCTGSGLTYKEAIQLAQTIPGVALTMWSGKGTCSIVGSNSKNASGDVWY